jgi:hypothetical protein
LARTTREEAPRHKENYSMDRFDRYHLTVEVWFWAIIIGFLAVVFWTNACSSPTGPEHDCTYYPEFERFLGPDCDEEEGDEDE